MKTGTGSQIVELGFAQIELAQRDDVLLRDIFGDRLPKVLEIDPEPVLLRATRLLDKGDMRNGEQTWIMGEHGIWMTTKQFENNIVPVLMNAPGYRGHLASRDYDVPVLTLLWVGIDERTQAPGGIIYLDPVAQDLRLAARSGAAVGNLDRKFPLSLRMDIELDWATMQMKGVRNKKRASVDLVRASGTEAAGVTQAIMLSEKDNSSSHGERATQERTMPTPLISFDTVEAMLSHPDVKSLIEARVKERIKEPATVHEVVLSASMDIVKEREDVKVLLAREPREVVVKSLNLEELDVALSANAELRERAAQTVEKLRKDTEHFTGQVREICLAEGLSAEQTNTVLATHDFSHRDPEKVKALVRTVKVNLSAGSTAGRGLSAKDEEVLPSFSPKPRTVEDVSRELDYCRRG